MMTLGAGDRAGMGEEEELEDLYIDSRTNETW